MPPAPTLIGKWSQAPALYELVIAIVLVVVPSLTVTFWRRVVESQSTTYRWSVPAYAALKFSRSRSCELSNQVAARRCVWSGLSSARTSVVGLAHTKRLPCSTVRVAFGSTTRSVELFHAPRAYPSAP